MKTTPEPDEQPLSTAALLRSAEYRLASLQSDAFVLRGIIEKLPGLSIELETQLSTLRVTLKTLKKKINRRK